MDNKVIKNPTFSNLNVDGYKWVVMYRDHYRGNSKGEYFLSDKFAKIMKEEPFWFYNLERPVHTVILTNDDVPTIVKQRCELINSLSHLKCDMWRCHKPAKGFDGRFTRNTHPELYAKYDKEVAEVNKKYNKLREEYNAVETKLKQIKYYSSTLHCINR